MDIPGKNIIIYADNNYQELELWYPLLRMREGGANVTIVAPEANQNYTSKHGYPVKSDATATSINAADIDALIVPGGYAPDSMRVNKAMVELVTKAHEHNKIIAAICHAAWVLVSANVLNGKQATCYHTIKDDVINAGATYLDQTVVQDGNLITSRQPNDLPAFCQAIIKALQD